MKHLILAAVVAALLAPAACVSTGADADEQLLSTIDRRTIQQMFPDADLSNLTRAQKGALSSTLNSSDNAFETSYEIRSILNWSE